jgi:hypothetical protein
LRFCPVGKGKDDMTVAGVSGDVWRLLVWGKLVGWLVDEES